MSNLAFNLREGSRPYVILLHGFLEERSMWNETMNQWVLPNGLVSIDLPGHGQSPWIPGLSIDDMANKVIELQEHLQIGPAILAGHSMGGYVALSVAEKTACKGLLLIHSTCLPDNEEKKKNRMRAVQVVNKNRTIFLNEAIPNLFRHPLAHNELISAMIKTAGAMSNEAIVGSLLAMKDRPERCHVLKDIPSAIISGRWDKAVDPEALFEQAEHATKSLHVWLQHSAHMGMVEEPELFHQSFIRSILHLSSD